MFCRPVCPDIKSVLLPFRHIAFDDQNNGPSLILIHLVGGIALMSQMNVTKERFTALQSAQMSCRSADTTKRRLTQHFRRTTHSTQQSVVTLLRR